MTYDQAVALVTADQREADPGITPEEAVAYVRNTMRLPEAPEAPGAYPLQEDGSALAAAYRIVLSA